MGRISQDIPNLFNGISQQSPSLRLPSQGETEVNGYSSLVEGLQKRPPVNHVAKLQAALSNENAYVHFINRDSTERYVVILADTGIRVFDLTGSEQSVFGAEQDSGTHSSTTHATILTDSTKAWTPSEWVDYTIYNVTDGSYGVITANDATTITVLALTGGTDNDWDNGDSYRICADISSLAYLNTSTPREDFYLLTIADHTFIVNKDVTTAFDSSESPDTEPNVAYVYVKTGLASKKYSVTVDGTECAYTTTTTAATYTTDNIASELETLIDAVANITCDRFGSMLKITKAAGADFTFTTYDSYGDTALVGMKGLIARSSKLPPNCWNEAKLLVQGDDETTLDDYYVEFTTLDGGTVGPGTWEECRGWSTENVLDATTMPHKLVRESDGAFTLEVCDWADRSVGDNDSSPAASFIGKKLNSMFFFRNRLGILADENPVLSRAGSFYNFWHESVMVSLDTDPIDLAASHEKVCILHHAIPWDKRLILFSEQTQFELSSGESVLTPDSAKIEPSTEFENDIGVRPVGVGRYIYFAVPKGSYTALKEYFVNEDNLSEDAADVTAHCPEYVPGNVTQIVGSTNDDALFVLSSDQPSHIYVYKYYWNGNEKLQSSWSHWTVTSTDNILKVFLVESTLWLVVSRDDGVYLEKIYLHSGVTDGDLTFPVFLDRKTELTGVYNGGTDETTWTLPYSDASTDFEIVLGPDFTGKHGGKVANTTRPSATTIKADGDWSDGECYVGKSYTHEYTFSTQYVRKDGVTVTEGRLQLQKMHVNFTDSGLFYIEVTPGSRSTYTYPNKVLLGTSAAVIGSPYIASGTLSFPVICNAENVTIKIVNDSYFPSNIQSAEWEGNFVMRTRRL